MDEDDGLLFDVFLLSVNVDDFNGVFVMVLCGMEDVLEIMNE